MDHGIVFVSISPGLGKAQQSLSRKKKFSQNWKRAKARLARLHIRVANARRDYLHKALTAISKNHAIVCVEDLRVSNMSSSAAGSRQSPGSQVRAKSGLNRSILDQGWAELRHQLEYKLAWNGVRLIAVRRSIPAGPVRSAGAPVQATARLRLGSAVWNAGVKPPPTWWQQSM